LVYLKIYPAAFYDMPNHLYSETEQPPMFSVFEQERIDNMLKSSKDLNPQRPAPKGA
jgi:hypothetical protein